MVVAGRHVARPTDLRVLVALAACGLGTVAIYAAGFSLPYPIAGGLAKPLLDFAKLSGPAIGPTVALVVAIGALFSLYGIALRLCRTIEGSSVGILAVGGFGCLAAAALLPMYPVFSLDVFYYMAEDRIWSFYRENPFLVPPLQAAHDPFFPYTSWGHYPLPYGPFWPWISSATSALGSGAVPATLLAFKGLALVGYLACLPLVLWAAAAANPTRRVTALCMFAWNPLVLIELAGNAHNDAIALVPAILALGLWARRRTALTALALAASFLVKATALVLVPPLLWASFAQAIGRPPSNLPPLGGGLEGGRPAAKIDGDTQPDGEEAKNWGPGRRLEASRRLALGTIRWSITHLLPGLVLCVIAWLPFWSASGSVGFLREFDQHYQSVTTILMAPVPPVWKPVALRALQAIMLLGFGFYGVSQLRHLAVGGKTALESTWRLTILYFILVSPFYVSWYMVWPVLLSSMLVDRRTTVLTSLLCIGSLATHLVQFVVVPLAGPSLGWAQINSLALLAAFGPFAAGWAALSRYRPARTPAPALR